MEDGNWFTKVEKEFPNVDEVATLEMEVGWNGGCPNLEEDPLFDGWDWNDGPLFPPDDEPLYVDLTW